MDVNTWKAYAEAITGKGTNEGNFETEGSVLNAMEKIINQMGKGEMKNLTTDRGSEFIGKNFTKLMKKYDINKNQFTLGYVYIIVEVCWILYDVEVILVPK